MSDSELGECLPSQRVDAMSVDPKTYSVQNCTLDGEVPFGGDDDDDEGGEIIDEGQDLRLPRFSSCFYLKL